MFSPHTHKVILCKEMGVLTNLGMQVISPCSRVSRHHIIHLKLHNVTCQLYLNKAGKIKVLPHEIFSTIFCSAQSLAFWRPCLKDSHLISPLASLIQEMNSDDPVVQEKAVLETEKRLQFMEQDREEDECRTTVNRTVISPPQAPAKVSFPSPGVP